MCQRRTCCSEISISFYRNLYIAHSQDDTGRSSIIFPWTTTISPPWIQWLNHGFLVARQLPCIHTNKCWIFQHLLVGSYKISLRARWHSKIYLTLLQFFDRNLPTCSKNLEFRIWSFHPDIGLSFKQCYSKVRIPRFRFRVTLLLLLTLFACYPRDHIQSIDVYCCKEAWGTHQKVLSYTKLRHSTTLNRIILVHSVRNVQ